MPNFATLTQIKSWLDITTSNDDSLLTTLISQISVAILEYLQRPDFIKSTFTELRSGVGNTRRLVLRNWPVMNVSSLIAGATTIQQSSSFTQPGYTLESWDGTSGGNPQAITLNGYTFPQGWNNVQIIYQAGYCVVGEQQSIIAQAITALQRYGMWTQDDGVSYANGTALIPVASNPSQGQYTVQNGNYGFNIADNLQILTLNYSYVPWPLNQACLEWIGERYRYKERIGETNRSLGGAMTAGYNLKMPDHIQTMLNPYIKFLPL